MTTAVDVRVTGQVQGVAFRWYAEQEAERLGVHGWIRNETDGSVAGHFEGDEEAVDAMVAWCRHGPSYASVAAVETSAAQATGASAFEIRF